MDISKAVVDEEEGGGNNNTLIHQMLLVAHVIVACLVFGALGRAIRNEYVRMKTMKIAREVAVKKKHKHHQHKHKHSSRSFAMEYAWYRADYFLSTSSFTKPLLLLLLTYVIIILGGVFYSYISGLPVLEALWLSWTMVC